MKKSLAFTSVFTKLLPVLILSSVCLSAHAGSYTLSAYGLSESKHETVSIPAGTEVRVAVSTSSGCDTRYFWCTTTALAHVEESVVISSGGPGESDNSGGTLISNGSVSLHVSVGIGRIGTGNSGSYYPSSAEVRLTW